MSVGINHFKKLEKEIKEIKERLDKIEEDKTQFIPRKLTPNLKLAVARYKKFREWLNSNKLQYKNKVIAFIEHDDKLTWDIIAIADSEEELFINMDKYFNKNKHLLNQKVSFYNFGESLGFFRH